MPELGDRAKTETVGTQHRKTATIAREEDKAWDRSWSSWGPRLRAMSGVNLG